MIVTLDGEKLADAYAGQTTLMELIDAVRTQHLPQRLVVGVARNGVPLVNSDLEASLNQPIGEDTQIDLDSAASGELIGAALRGLADQLEQAGADLLTIADALLGQDKSSAIRRVGDFVGQWQAVRDVMVQASGLLDQDLTLHVHAGQTVGEHLQEVVRRLNDVRSALEANDLVLLTDLVRYELPPLCETWSAALREIADAL